MPSSTSRVSLAGSALPQSRSQSRGAKDTSLFATLTRKVDATPKGKSRDVGKAPKADKFKDELNRASESKKPKREKDEVENKPAAKKSEKASGAKKATKSRKPEADESVEETASESVASSEEGAMETTTTDVEATDAPVDETNPDHDVDGESDEASLDPSLAAAINAENAQVRATTAIDPAHDDGETTDETAEDVIDGSKPATVLKSAANEKTSPEDAIQAIDGDEQAGGDEDVDPNASQFDAELPDESLTDPDAQDVAKTPKKGAAASASHAKSESSTWGAPAQSQARETKTIDKTQSNAGANAAMNAVEVAASPTDGSDGDRTEKTPKAVDLSSSFAKTLEMFGGDAPKQAATVTGPNGQAPVAKLPPDQQFATDNHPNIVSNVRGNLLPTGGTMHIRLDPPELGQMQIMVNVRDGVMTATFETSNDEATRMLSHSLGELKGALEASGVAVDKLHVQQSAKSDQPADKRGDGSGSQQGQMNDSSARREQERKELLRRMWEKLTTGADPLDTIA